jgi:hypothetical protein
MPPKQGCEVVSISERRLLISFRRGQVQSGTGPMWLVVFRESDTMRVSEPKMGSRRRWRSRRNAQGSYLTTCKWCGERIHMRQMPHGQWVAFEGAESVHHCGQLSDYGPTSSTSQRGSFSTQTPTVPQPTAKTEVLRCGACGQNNRVTEQASSASHRCGRCKSPLPNPFGSAATVARKKKQEGLPWWVWWVIGAIVLFFLMKK